MKHLLAGILVWVIWGLCSCQSDGKVIIPSPIYVDNHYHGPADPEITWNPKTEEWMIFYTSRRPWGLLCPKILYIGSLRDIARSMV